MTTLEQLDGPRNTMRIHARVRGRIRQRTRDGLKFDHSGSFGYAIAIQWIGIAPRFIYSRKLDYCRMLPTPTSIPRRPALRPTRSLLRCPACLRVQLRPPETFQRLTANRWPECCGRLMVPAGPAAGEVPDPDADATLCAERRVVGRRSPRADARVECRRVGPGPDVAIALLDVAASGLKVAVRGLLRRGERVRVAVGLPGEPWAYHGPAVVRWSVAGAEGTALVGLRLRRPFTAQTLAALSE